MSHTSKILREVAVFSPEYHPGRLARRTRSRSVLDDDFPPRSRGVLTRISTRRTRRIARRTRLSSCYSSMTFSGKSWCINTNIDPGGSLDAIGRFVLYSTMTFSGKSRLLSHDEYLPGVSLDALGRDLYSTMTFSEKSFTLNNCQKMIDFIHIIAMYFIHTIGSHYVPSVCRFARIYFSSTRMSLSENKNRGAGRRATAAAAAVVGSRCLSRGREVAPIPVRPRTAPIRRARRDLQCVSYNTRFWRISARYTFSRLLSLPSILRITGGWYLASTGQPAPPASPFYCMMPARKLSRERTTLSCFGGRSREQRIRVLQLNLNHCETAQDLVLHTVGEMEVDVAILSDQHRPLTSPNTWISDADNQAAIWVRKGVPVQRCSSGQSHFYTWAQIAGIYIFSIYAPPRLSQEEFIGLLNNIVDEARGKTPILVAGDFNAWATEWGTITKLLCMRFSLRKTKVLAVLRRATVGGAHEVSTAIALLRSCQGWRSGRGFAEDMVDELMSTITRACDASMSGARYRRRREPAYWWNDDIAECRRDCIRARRCAQRARGRPDEVIRREEFANARRRLRDAIKVSKRLCWRQLCDEADRDVWGKPYRTVMSRLRAPRTSSPTAPDLVRRTHCPISHQCKRWHRGTKKYCAIITLDVRNAFNSARWDKILTALSQMEVPAYLQRMVSNYFRGRVLEFTTDDGAETYEVTAGVPQGSTILQITVVAKHLDLVEFYSNETIRLVRAALTELGLQTADQKTEVLLVTSRKVTETITVRAGGHYITSAPCIRYLGVHIDARLRFEEHLRIVSDKANRVAGALLGLMPNIGGPRSSRLRLYANVVDSILLYGAPAWSEAAKKQSYTRRAALIHRAACLRVICGFCSISHEATYVLASIPPLTLLIDERSRLYSRRLESVGSEERARQSRNGRPNGPARGRVGGHTDSSPNITPWIERRHGEVGLPPHATPDRSRAASGHTCVGAITTQVTCARYVLRRWKTSNTSLSAALDLRRRERCSTASSGVPWSLRYWTQRTIIHGNLCQQLNHLIGARKILEYSFSMACDWTTNPPRIRKARMPKSGHDLRRYSGRRARQLRKRPEHPLTMCAEKLWINTANRLRATRNTRLWKTRAIALQDATAETVADAFLKEFICIFSCPQIILSDQGTNFTSKVFVNLAKAFKIKTVTTTAYRPSSNGSLERSHHSLAEYLKTVAGKNKEWDDMLEMAMFSYNTSVHEAHQFQPFQLVFGKLPTLPTAETIEKSGKIVTYTDYVRKLCKTLSEIKSIAREKLIDAKLRNKFYYDKKANAESFKPGDYVYLLKGDTAMFPNGVPPPAGAPEDEAGAESMQAPIHSPDPIAAWMDGAVSRKPTHLHRRRPFSIPTHNEGKRVGVGVSSSPDTSSAPFADSSDATRGAGQMVHPRATTACEAVIRKERELVQHQPPTAQYADAVPAYSAPQSPSPTSRNHSRQLAETAPLRGHPPTHSPLNERRRRR
ncbi:unnamed protein product [Trichogramma brassicae]|uniref:Integrase catalytic domain-containing protein n=1 Tax=Trichogramma brassicae TaxID=86971 RepID=A0A6H5IIT0_9HYME|nr:unnamed protein product [Trichogramma brassicae]